MAGKPRFAIRRPLLPPQPDLDLEPFSFGPEDAPLACLLIHGFSGSPPEMRPLGEFLASRGVRVEGVRLAGHGTAPEELTTLTWHDWLLSAEDGLARLSAPGRRIVLVGFSMGGLLALQLCSLFPAIAGVVTISSPIYFRDQRIHMVPMISGIVRWHRVKRPSLNIDPEAHTRYFSYRRYPTVAVGELLHLMRTTRRLLKDVRTPALVMHGMFDRVVDPRSAPYIYKHLGSPRKELVWWHNSGHGVVFDTEREAVWNTVSQFIERRAA